VVRLLQSVFEDAIQVRASDIHIEPQENEPADPLSLDGVLSLATEADRKIGPALIQRLKLMADLDIAEKRLPQDGRFVVRLKKRAIECAYVDTAGAVRANPRCCACSPMRRGRAWPS